VAALGSGSQGSASFPLFTAYSQILNGRCRGGSSTVDTAKEIHKIWLQVIIALWFPRVYRGTDRLVTVSDDVYMSRAMVVWINGHPQRANPQNGWKEIVLP